MKRMMLIGSSERTFIVSALIAYDASGIAAQFNHKFETADPVDTADDGPEVEILKEPR